MGVSKKKEVNKLYKVEKDPLRTGGYTEQEVDKTQLYNWLMRNYNMNRNKRCPINMKKEVKEIEYKSSPAFK